MEHANFGSNSWPDSYSTASSMSLSVMYVTVLFQGAESQLAIWADDQPIN
jgi:hypothetical protein